MSPEKAYILGVLCGDGHINQDYVRFEIRNDEEFVKEFVRCFEEVYGLRYNYKYYLPRKSYVLYIASQVICKDLLNLGDFGTRAWRIPRDVLKSEDIKITGAFLRGFYDSEGSVGKSAISASSINLKGLKQVSSLLETLGIQNIIRPIKDKYYLVYIFRKQRFKIFRERIGFTILRKQERLNEILKNDRHYKEA